MTCMCIRVRLQERARRVRHHQEMLQSHAGIQMEFRICLMVESGLTRQEMWKV